MKVTVFIRSFLLLCGLAVFAADTAYGQTARRSGTSRRNTPVQQAGPAAPAQAQSEDDAVKTVDLGDKKAGDTTASGEQEGLSSAPALPSETDKEQSGQDVLPLVPSLNGIRTDVAREAHTSTRTSARTMSLMIPAPRGPILDRNGEPLALTQVAYQLALKFEIFEESERSRVVEFGRHCLEQASKIAGKTWTFSDDQLWKHYEHRRWLPLPLTNVIRAEEAEQLKERVKGVRGLQLLPIYIRYYPEKQIAGHINGYVGSKGKLPTGPINHMDPLWEQVEGRAGLEKEFNKELTGTPGVWRLMFDEEGNKILDELQIRPKPGGTVVTTLNLKWQRSAEQILSQGKRRGAMVVLDCVTGEVLVMASTPSYDPNMFIPNISQKDYDALRTDPAGPLGARAFQGRYPPASTFKVLTVASALRHNLIQEESLVDCPAFIQVGNHVFKNWKPVALGNINCIRGLAMSNNPFMYKMGMRLGAENLMDTARTFGFGSRTGLPIADDPGLVPSSDYMVRNYRRDFMLGDAANLSIGQGTLLVTPLQVAHMMAGVANGNYLPKLHLIKQIQDGNANVIKALNPQEIQTPLTVYERALTSVRKGMKAVIEEGTGGRARLSYASIAGKSGTAQWGPEREDKRLAWFAGFMPYENPRFAYVVLYEGRPHEKLGGGAAAAPIVKEFFETHKKDIKAIIDPPSDDIPVAEPVEETSATATAPSREDVSPAVVPDNLPPGLYDPEGMEPVKVHEIPQDLDDSSDAEIKAAPVGPSTRNFFPSPPPLREDPVASPLEPERGDADYIPGLQRQVPRHLNRSLPVSSPAPRAPVPADEIPLAEPI